MPTFGSAVLGVGVVIPIEIFRRVFPGDLENVSNNLAGLTIYYSTGEDDPVTNVFLTTNDAINAEEYHPTRIHNINQVMQGADQFQNWVNQVFPEVAQNFGLILYAYSFFE